MFFFFDKVLREFIYYVVKVVGYFILCYWEEDDTERAFIVLFEPL